MGNGMSMVIPGLYVGNLRDSEDQDQLYKNKITHIISIHDNAREVLKDKKYLIIQASDSPHQNLSQFFPRSNDFIHNARISGGNVLVHCLVGMSRSVTVAAAYIMCVTSLDHRDAMKVVRGARNVANPNLGFQKQLQDFEHRKISEERKRLRYKYSHQSLEQDEKICRKLVTNYNKSTETLNTRFSACQ
ncbi:dual specificity protein phosphatase 22-like [Limulus polyphemus]|uniref:Dual specificity protein phosphatase 22-like n=1 Tax=Limulus polyphemus TaxID=6850 RepID=A0ABM1C655_LIMPO|nr:dual specificity protein phosphatase 22-like [Limulus polyphemus]